MRQLPVGGEQQKPRHVAIQPSHCGEALAAKFNESCRTMEVSFGFGNFITPVLRGTPCEHVVIEAFVRKFFVSASEVGFKAIEPLIKQLILKE